MRYYKNVISWSQVTLTDNKYLTPIEKIESLVTQPRAHKEGLLKLFIFKDTNVSYINTATVQDIFYKTISHYI